MSTLTIKGVCLGTGRPKTIVSLMDKDAASLTTSARRAVEAGADCLEWRIDFLPEEMLSPACVLRIARELHASLPDAPLVATVRTRGQGGQVDLSGAAYAELVGDLIRTAAPDLIDIELGVGDKVVRALVSQARAQGVRTIVSHHDFVATPSTSEMEELLVHMAALGADIPKLAVMATCTSDCLRLMEVTARAQERLEMPLVTMAMGEKGALSRLAGEAFGSALTFCALGAPSAPGQVGLAQATATLRALHTALLGASSDQGRGA